MDLAFAGFGARLFNGVEASANQIRFRRICQQLVFFHRQCSHQLPGSPMPAAVNNSRRSVCLSMTIGELLDIQKLIAA